ncbi:MAG: cytochrome-c peroxidase [Hyphomicrobiales bacterium]
MGQGAGENAKTPWRATGVGVVLLLAFGNASGAQETALTPQETAVALTLSPLAPPAHDPTNAVSGQCGAIDFGRNLFFDLRLSRDNNRSCATCHIPQEGLADGRAVAAAPSLLRNTPSLWNVAHNRWFFWDGRADSLWAQAAGPIEAAAELNLDRRELARRVATEPDLRREYEALFGTLPNLIASSDGSHAADTAWEAMPWASRAIATEILVNVAKAIAAFEETLTSADAPFDRFVRSLRLEEQAGSNALPASALRGLKVFVGRGQCYQCHDGPNFSDGEFHNMMALPEDGDAQDPGRYRGLELLDASEMRADGRFSSSRDRDRIAKLKAAIRGEFTRGQFKTPSLRNVADRTAFLHHGQMLTLKGAVARYSSLRARAREDARADPVVSTIEVFPQDTEDLVAFLQTLTDTSRLNTIWDDCSASPPGQ